MVQAECFPSAHPPQLSLGASLQPSLSFSISCDVTRFIPCGSLGCTVSSGQLRSCAQGGAPSLAVGAHSARWSAVGKAFLLHCCSIGRRGLQQHIAARCVSARAWYSLPQSAHKAGGEESGSLRRCQGPLTSPGLYLHCTYGTTDLCVSGE